MLLVGWANKKKKELLSSLLYHRTSEDNLVVLGTILDVTSTSNNTSTRRIFGFISQVPQTPIYCVCVFFSSELKRKKKWKIEIGYWYRRLAVHGWTWHSTARCVAQRPGHTLVESAAGSPKLQSHGECIVPCPWSQTYCYFSGIELFWRLKKKKYWNQLMKMCL